MYQYGPRFVTIVQNQSVPEPNTILVGFFFLATMGALVRQKA